MSTMTPTTDLARMLIRARARTDALFDLLRPEAFYQRPVPERHRLIFYLGHLEAFDRNLLSQGAAARSSPSELDQLFAFGIDPRPGELPQDKPSDWPKVAQVHQYNVRVRRDVDDLLNRASDQWLSVALEHRLMHAETFAYLLHQVSPDEKDIPVSAPLASHPPPIAAMMEIPGGRVTLGRGREPSGRRYEFGWDNEFDGHEVSVSSFAMSKYKVTNGDYLAFVRAGAEPPSFWSRHGEQWYWRGMSGEIPLPLDWPVYATHDQARAFAAWTGKRLPTEAEFHRAAYGVPGGEEERSYPWGEDRPDGRRGNFDGNRWDPLPVTATPLGDSAFGIAQLVGNGWEWTSTPFQPFPGFQPFSFYPGYSARFFDGQHYVLKGASSRTDALLLRRSFRNWFRPNFPYVYAGFRCVES
ncbi:MAG TPA: SUMF1/EgtB/PvdO family nonheme iron enzyme [Nitrospira sp.]